MTEKEKEALLEEFGIQDKDLPKILTSDPVLKLIKARLGQVLRITRKSPTAGESVYYRIVAED